MNLLTVRNSIDGKSICIEGTADALGMVSALIGQLLADPEDRQIRAIHQSDGVDIIIKLVDGVFDFKWK